MSWISLRDKFFRVHVKCLNCRHYLQDDLFNGRCALPDTIFIPEPDGICEEFYSRDRKKGEFWHLLIEAAYEEDFNEADK